MEILESKFVRELISSVFDIDLMINEGTYFMFIQNNVSYISFSDRKRKHKLPSGIIILEKIKTKWKMLPSIINIIEDIIVLKINDLNIVKKVTFGEKVLISENDGLYILSDRIDRKIAFGKILNKYFHPFTDLGYYLREESL